MGLAVCYGSFNLINLLVSIVLINPRCACAVRVMVVGSVCLSVCLLSHTGVLIWRYDATNGVSDKTWAPKAIFWAPSHALLNSLAYTAKVYHSSYQRTTKQWVWRRMHAPAEIHVRPRIARIPYARRAYTCAIGGARVRRRSYFWHQTVVSIAINFQHPWFYVLSVLAHNTVEQCYHIMTSQSCLSCSRLGWDSSP